MMSQNPKTAPAAPTPKKRSVFGLLFNPRIGDSIAPLRENNRIFVQLVASVFAIYGLFPKDHPALRDNSIPLSLFQVIRTAWGNVELTRAGLPKTIMFFAVLGIMIVSTFAIISFVLSLFIGHAHAAGSVFTAPDPDTDVAYNWMEYLFNGGTYPGATYTGSDGTTSALQNPFTGSVSLQVALTAALGIYSGAILIIAAIILFYHLAAMVAETAHYGVPMGKRASQVWAPIRLVVAIGLLVPINSGLNSGQYIVLKLAEMGSGLASNVWSGFLTQLESYTAKPLVPTGKIQADVIENILLMEACQRAWNARIAFMQSQINLSGSNVNLTSSSYVLGGATGTKYSFSSNAIKDQDVCGWYFVPNGAPLALGEAIAADQNKEINKAIAGPPQAVKDIDSIVNTNLAIAGATPTAGVTLDDDFTTTVDAYQKALDTDISAETAKSTTDVASAMQQITPYGWAIAGTVLNTVERIQATTSAAVTNSVPKTESPILLSDESDADEKASINSTFGRGKFAFSDASDIWSIENGVKRDLADYVKLQSVSINNPSNGANATQCASMVALSNSTDSSWKVTSWGVNTLFAAVDTIASQNGVWSNGTGNQCAKTNQSTFQLGIQFNTSDPLTQMAYLGHANIGTAFDLLTVALAGAAVSGIPLVGGLGSAIAGLASFIAFVFWVAGFTLAFLVPLMPFMRFFFAVLTWAAAVIEGVVAIPLVALGHLNPEGEGISGQAKNAYYFIFNIMLRPVLTVFGLVCGLLMFFIAISFLNYGYGIAVAGAGATSYGYVTMSKMIYSVIYAALAYVCANHCFHLIEHLPQYAMGWMGGAGHSAPAMGSADKIETIGALVSGVAGRDTMGKMVSGVSGTSRAIGNGVGKLMNSPGGGGAGGNEPGAGGGNGGGGTIITGGLSANQVAAIASSSGAAAGGSAGNTAGGAAGTATGTVAGNASGAAAGATAGRMAGQSALGPYKGSGPSGDKS